MDQMQRVGVILLTGERGGFAIVDPERADELSQCKWWQDTWGYVMARRPGTRHQKLLRLHRVVMSAKDGQEVDHKYRDKLDNRADSLRFATPSQNRANTPKRNGSFSSRYKGVDFHCGAWRASIRINIKKTHLGRFQSETEAAKAYNVAALDHFGEFANLNEIT